MDAIETRRSAQIANLEDPLLQAHTPECPYSYCRGHKTWPVCVLASGHVALPSPRFSLDICTFTSNSLLNDRHGSTPTRAFTGRARIVNYK